MGAKHAVADTQHLLLYFNKMSNSVANLRLVRRFLIDTGHIIRYNRGYRFYKDLYCKLSPEIAQKLLEEQRAGKFNKSASEKE